MENINAISKKQIQEISEFLKIASDETRIKIMLTLLDDSKCTCGCNGTCDCGCCKHKHCMIEKSVSEIYQSINCSQSLVSHQLKILKDAKLVKARKEKTKVYYSLDDGHVKSLLLILLEHISEGK
jgi:DNA-binding transcriptional ArsR family regulator